MFTLSKVIVFQREEKLMVAEKQQENKVRQWVLDAEERCREHINETPLEYSLYLSKLTGAEVYLKLDMTNANYR
jgi:hypothetical protein